jgi:hypothetical protein
MTKTTPEQNKALVLEAFDTLFNRPDYDAATRFWSDDYIQHSAHIEPGREGLFNLIRSAPAALRYEHQLIVAEGDYVLLHGRFSGIGRLDRRGYRPASRTAAPLSTGTCLRTRPQRLNPGAACLCSATNFRNEQPKEETRAARAISKSRNRPSDLERGDVAVQNGTRHAWRNKGTRPVTMFLTERSQSK